MQVAEWEASCVVLKTRYTWYEDAALNQSLTSWKPNIVNLLIHLQPPLAQHLLNCQSKLARRGRDTNDSRVRCGTVYKIIHDHNGALRP